MQTRRAVFGMLAAAPTFARATAAMAKAPSGPDLVAAARRQIGVTTHYDPGYHRIGYPWGDLPRDTGVCADVVIRAVRDAWHVDLQQLVHEDMARNFAAYPHRWGLPGPDSNIDHRRVPNLETFWTRHGGRVWQAEGPTWGGGFPGPLQPGDILTWRKFMGGGPHVAIVSTGGVWPRIIQNFGWGARKDLFIPPWTGGANGRYRWLPRV
jgi:uncharacterized protein YijF (DUF1287 family)